jgi:signal transduction histidine kinase
VNSNGREPWRGRLVALAPLVLVVPMVLITRHIKVEDGQRELDALGYAVIAAAVGALVLRRRWPELALALTSAMLVTYAVADYAGGPIYVVFCVALYSVAVTRGRLRTVVLSMVATALVMAAAYLPDPLDKPLWGPLVLFSWSLAVVIGGQAKQAHLANNAARDRALDEQRREEARRQMIEERLRIARDLHDVVAHSISSISVQSGAAAHVFDRSPEQAKEALLGIQQTSKDALAELRATLDLLRDTSESAPRAPVARLTDLRPLIDAAGRAGLSVITNVDGIVRPLPPAVDTAGYRIVQESLTNAMRHSSAVRAHVSLVYGPDVVEIEVTDEGPSRNGSNGTDDDDRAGHGIAGMHERAELIGGRLQAGARPEGGFRVWTRLPAAAVGVGSEDAVA